MGVVAVAVTVGVAVLVAAAGAFGGGGVEHKGHVAVFLFVVEALELGEHGAFEESGADYEDGAVNDGFDDLCVGHHLYGRTVDEDVVVFVFEVFDHLDETGRFEQLGGVGRYGAYGDYREVLTDGVGDGDAVDVVDAAYEVVAEAGLGRADIDGGGAAAKVAVNDDDFLAFDGEADGCVHGDECLAGAGVERCDHYHVGAFAGGEEAEVGAEHAEGFVDHVSLAGLYYDAVYA